MSVERANTDIQATVYLVGLLLADGWQFWLLLALYALTAVAGFCLRKAEA